MDDLISRQAALCEIKLLYPDRPLLRSLRDRWKRDNAQYIECEDVLRNLPTANRPKGEWIYCEDDCGNDGYRCDKCGYHVPWDYSHKSIYFIEEYNYCPNCGADMRGEQDAD